MSEKTFRSDRSKIGGDCVEIFRRQALKIQQKDRVGDGVESVVRTPLTIPIYDSLKSIFRNKMFTVEINHAIE